MENKNGPLGNPFAKQAMWCSPAEDVHLALCIIVTSLLRPKLAIPIRLHDYAQEVPKPSRDGRGKTGENDSNSKHHDFNFNGAFVCHMDLVYSSNPNTGT